LSRYSSYADERHNGDNIVLQLALHL